MPNPIFSNEYGINSHRLTELIMRWETYKYQIDSPTLLNQIRYTLAKDYYKDAVSWLKLFKDAEWYRVDLI